MEKLILERIHEIEKENNVDLTGHKLKSKSAGMQIRLALARTLDQGKLALIPLERLNLSRDLG